MLRYLLIAFQLTLMMAAPAARAAALVIDGVSLPANASVASVPKSATDLQRRWSGVWTGAWNGALKHVLLVERIGEDGAAGVVYAEADNPYTAAPASWWRLDAVVSGRTLTVTRPAFTATYELDDDGQLKAFFKGSRIARAAMSRTDLASLTKPGAVVAWSRGTSESANGFARRWQSDPAGDGNFQASRAGPVSARGAQSWLDRQNSDARTCQANLGLARNRRFSQQPGLARRLSAASGSRKIRWIR